MKNLAIMADFMMSSDSG